jgi:hypothetical protein
MAFDIDEFLKQEAKNKSVAAPAVNEPSDKFNIDAFLSNPANAIGSSAEPALVANVPAAGVSAPGQPMETPPTPGGLTVPVPGSDYAMPVQPPVVNPTGPGLASQLGGTALGQEASQMAANAGRIAKPFATAGSTLLNSYVTNPITKLAPDLAAVSMGVPPPNATSKALGATQGAFNVARSLPGGPGVSIAPPAPPGAAQVSSNPMLAEMAARQAAAEAETMANRSVIQKIAMSKVMQMAAPALNTAAKVAGPAGLAYNAYEAGNMARDTQLGERLAQGQGQAAPQAFAQRNPVYGNNKQITADQARSILSSGSQRDIQAFGGTDFLRKRALGQP